MKHLFFLFLTYLAPRTEGGDLILISPGQSETANEDAVPTFYISAKTIDLYVKGGDTVDMTCQTSQPWHYCSWQLPQGESCDRLSTSKYDKTCHHNTKVRFQRAFKHPGVRAVNPNQDCSVTIVGVEAVDGGNWQCFLKEDVKSDRKWVENVALTVALPFHLSLEPEYPTIDKNLNETLEEIVCMASGSGGVDPELTWQIDGKPAESQYVKQWDEHNSNGTHIVFLSLNLEDNPAIINFAKLRCFSKQLYPNGTVIYESSVSTEVIIHEKFEQKALTETSNEAGLIAGAVITAIIVAAVLIAIILICYAQKYKKWCYTRDKPKAERSTSPARSVPPPSNDTAVPDTTDSQEEQLNLLSLDEGIRNSFGNLRLDLASTHNSNLHFDEANTPPGSVPPPSAPPIEQPATNLFDVSVSESQSSIPPSAGLDSSGSNLAQSNLQSQLSSSSSQRLMEIIGAPPPTVPSDSNNPQSSSRTSLPIGCGNTDSPRTFSVPSSRGLSDGLTDPKPTGIRRHNEYVKVKPKSVELQNSEHHYSSIDTIENPEQEREVAAEVDVHNEAISFADADDSSPANDGMMESQSSTSTTPTATTPTAVRATPSFPARTVNETNL